MGTVWTTFIVPSDKAIVAAEAEGQACHDVTKETRSTETARRVHTY